MPATPLGNAPIREVIVDKETGRATAGFAKWLSTIAAKFMTADDSTNSTVSVTSSDIGAVSSADASTTTGTATSSYLATPGDLAQTNYGFASAAEMNNAITAINTIKTLTNELKTINATIRTLNNELKADVNILVTDMNDLKTKLRAAGIIA